MPERLTAVIRRSREGIEAGLEGEYAPEYLVEPEHIRKGLAEA